MQATLDECVQRCDCVREATVHAHTQMAEGGVNWLIFSYARLEKDREAERFEVDTM